MKIEKPNWTPLELHEKMNRQRELLNQVINHEADCQCSACMEGFGLGELTSLFTEDEHFAAFRAGREQAARKNDA